MWDFLKIGGYIFGFIVKAVWCCHVFRSLIIGCVNFQDG